jgi:hypothetical protein
MANPSNPQQLLIVKDFFGEGQTLALREDTFSTSKAILFLDLAVEQMMRAIIATLNPSKQYKKDPNWHELWTDASAVLQTKGFQLHNHFPLKALHGHRNMVQHVGASYHYSQARNHVAPVEDMLSQAFRDVYGLDFSRYNLLSLIANEDLRRWLQDAEQILSEGGPMFTMAACNYAHRLVIAQMQKKTQKWQSHRSTRSTMLHGLDIKDSTRLAGVLQALDNRITHEIAALEEEVAAIGVGLSILEVRRFRSFGELVSISVFQDGQIKINGKEGTVEDRKEAAAFMLDYLSRLIRSIEQTYHGVLEDLKIKVPLMDQEIVKHAQQSN